MRVYPKATRLDSSNFNPLIGWMHGVQMVAFNMQVSALRGRLLRVIDQIDSNMIEYLKD